MGKAEGLLLDAGLVDGVLDHVAQLADVAGPVVMVEDVEHVRGQGEARLAVLRRQLPGKMGREQSNVLLAVLQRRDVDGEGGNAVEEVLSHELLLNEHLGILVAGGDHPDIALVILAAANALVALFLEDPEELGLHLHAHGVNLVEEQGSALRELEETFFGHAAGERAFFRAKEQALHEVGGYSAAVDVYKGLVRPGAEIVDALGEHFLSGSGFPCDHDVDVGQRNLFGKTDALRHFFGLVDDFFEGVHVGVQEWLLVSDERFQVEGLVFDFVDDGEVALEDASTVEFVPDHQGVAGVDGHQLFVVLCLEPVTPVDDGLLGPEDAEGGAHFLGELVDIQQVLASERVDVVAFQGFAGGVAVNQIPIAVEDLDPFGDFVQGFLEEAEHQAVLTQEEQFLLANSRKLDLEEFVSQLENVVISYVTESA